MNKLYEEFEKSQKNPSKYIQEEDFIKKYPQDSYSKFVMKMKYENDEKLLQEQLKNKLKEEKRILVNEKRNFVGNKFNDWFVISWEPSDNIIGYQIDKYFIRCKCGKEVYMRWQSFTKKTKCCRVCAIEERNKK